MRRNIPALLSFAIARATVLLSTPIISAISCVPTNGFARIDSRIFCGVFCGVDGRPLALEFLLYAANEYLLHTVAIKLSTRDSVRISAVKTFGRKSPQLLRSKILTLEKRLLHHSVRLSLSFEI